MTTDAIPHATLTAAGASAQAGGGAMKQQHQQSPMTSTTAIDCRSF